jgi:hypothetical protein
MLRDIAPLVAGTIRAGYRNSSVSILENGNPADDLGDVAVQQRSSQES